MSEKSWSPFDPEWYKQAFDKFDSTADELFKTDEIIKQGYSIPDADGSKSSAFRNEAVLNNSFDENILRSTLKDLYLNSTHKLIASNHDNIDFYQWHGNIKDLELTENTYTAIIRLPISFINSQEKDNYKLSQFSRKWISFEELMNTNKVFDFSIMIFINQKIFTNFEMRMDDHETLIRFKYNDYWVKKNYPVYLYKFTTATSCNFKITRLQCETQWKWKIPIDETGNPKLTTVSSIMLGFNKIPRETNLGIDPLGHNIEIINIKDGIIDLSTISNLNKALILSESQWISVSVWVPKFIHQYPILLPTDLVYRPYEPDLKPVVIMEYDRVQYVKSELNSEKPTQQVYVDIKDKLKDDNAINGWKEMIRPIVLSDAYDEDNMKSYMDFINELMSIRDLCTEAADTVEEFRFFLKEYTTDDEFNRHLDLIYDVMNRLHKAFNDFHDNHLMEYDLEYEGLFNEFISNINDIREEGVNSDWFSQYTLSDDTKFFTMVSPIYYTPREFVDKYKVFELIESINSHNFVSWDNKEELKGTWRFQRPIDVTDFWTFEFNMDDATWRPYPLKLTHHFPDVYTLEDPSGKDISGRVFQAFFFYSDTINVREEYKEIIRPSSPWNECIEKYHISQEGSYRDIFMEKFYWLGIKEIYKGLLDTKSRWECIEYIIDNESYERYNQLFMNTMDPYYKMGLATYLKSNNYQFPFDDAIDKLKENINNKFLNYQRVTSFETYIINDWIPSYFDFIEKILDDYNGDERLIRRPRSTFDINRLLPTLLDIQNDIYKITNDVKADSDWLLEKISAEKTGYNINIGYISQLVQLVTSMDNNIGGIIKAINDLDLPIYSIDDINQITQYIRDHNTYVDGIESFLSMLYSNVKDVNVAKEKAIEINKIHDTLDGIYDAITLVANTSAKFDAKSFMDDINQLGTYKEYPKNNDDGSLLGYVNQFNDIWALDIQELRDNLFKSTSKLYGLFDPTKSYSTGEIAEFVYATKDIEYDLKAFREGLITYWKIKGKEPDSFIIDKLDYADKFISDILVINEELIEAFNQLHNITDSVLDIIENIRFKYILNSSELIYIDYIVKSILGIFQAVSYIVGNNKRVEAFNNHQYLINYVAKWVQFNTLEQEIFDKLFAFCEPPVKFLETLKTYHTLLDAICLYMDTINNPYVPDEYLPTYSDVYEINGSYMCSGGFLHKAGELAFVPNVGVYDIMEVTDDIGECTWFDCNNDFRTTTFKNPCVDNPDLPNRVYDSITNGKGLGLTVEALESYHTSIIDDSVVISIFDRIRAVIKNITNNIKEYNSHLNFVLQININEVKSIHDSWTDIVFRYRDHLSDDTYEFTHKTVNDLVALIPSLESYISFRDQIDISLLIRTVNEYMTSCKKYIDSQEYNDVAYTYHNEAITKYNELLYFYGTGTSWTDITILNTLIYNMKSILKVYHNKIEFNDDINLFYTEVLDIFDIVTKAIDDQPNQVTICQIEFDSIIDRLSEQPELQVDTWYKINTINIANGGKNYKVGDIVEIIPKLPTDPLGNEIYGQDDIIMNDRVLVQITAVDDNQVTSVKPFMNYALPYLIWGIRETKTLVGDGSGLVLDVMGKQLQLSDSTVFEDRSSYKAKPNQYDENDLFLYKFDNDHNLVISYEVYIGGQQITDFYLRHKNDIDLIYINANSVNNLRNASIYIPGEHYFVYKLDDIEVVDPGAGYAVGQNIYLDTNGQTLKLCVTELDDTPYKGIKSVEMTSGNIEFKGVDITTKHAKCIRDSMNNIDDEYTISEYDLWTSAGTLKPLTKTIDPELYTFVQKRFDGLEHDNRNAKFVHPIVDLPHNAPSHGDPDIHYYLGSRIDNSDIPVDNEYIWEGINELIHPADPFISASLRLPPEQPYFGDYQLIKVERIHNSVNETNTDVNTKKSFSIKNAAMIEGDLQVESVDKLPKTLDEWPLGAIGKKIIIENDQTHEGHRMLYEVRTFIMNGEIIYEDPIIADYEWNEFKVNWMNMDYHPDIPGESMHYPDYDNEIDYKHYKWNINDGKYEDQCPISLINNSTYISQLTVDDLSVFNWTTHQWEDLHDKNKWELTVTNDDENKSWGFILRYIPDGDECYSYRMSLYLNKVPSNQMRNAALKKDAYFNVSSTIIGEVNTLAINKSVNTGRHLRIRKKFPYYQSQSYTLGIERDGNNLGFEMDFKLNSYSHFRNEIHVEDIIIYNKTAGRYEDVLNTKMFEVRIKDPKAVTRGYETNTVMKSWLIGTAGKGFTDGMAWGYNEEYNISVFGEIKSDYMSDGHLTYFKPIHAVNMPNFDIELEFQIYQSPSQSTSTMATAIIEFKTERIETWGDGYIHNVTNALAPINDEFKIIVLYDFPDGINEYEISIDKSSKEHVYIDSKWTMSPVIHIPYSIPSDRLYILTDKGRFPMVNSSTNKPSFVANPSESGTDIHFLNLYRRYEKLRICSTPYPMRSVYIQKKIPSHGYIDLDGKINKPLNKRYYEFWVNGKLLDEEVTIITPTKLILHGLTSLRNFEIIEINRDPNEYFSDEFITVEKADSGRWKQKWNYRTYLDDVLEGKLEGDNYTVEEQEQLLTPIWKQVEDTHPEFKNYPPNVDIDDDIMMRVDPADYPLGEVSNPLFQYMIINPPTIEGMPVDQSGLSFEHFGFTPITDEEIIKMLNEVWRTHIDNDPYFKEHTIMNNEEWYGLAVKLYNSKGQPVNDFKDAAYYIISGDMLRINSRNKLSHIIHNPKTYDLS